MQRAFAILLVACDAGPGAAACFGVCGAGTRCVDRKCVPEEVDPEPVIVAEEDASPKGKRRRRGKKGDEEEDAPDTPGFTPIDDSEVPEYDGNKTQIIDMKVGTERLDDSVVNSHLRRLEPRFNKCIETAAEHSETDIQGGEMDLKFSIAASGKVSGVSVKAPAHLRVFGIVPCIRKALAGHRFPSFDGMTMGVDYSFKVG